MAVQDKPTLKTYFETGDKPSEANFEDLIDSFQHVDDKATEQNLMDHTDDAKFATASSLKKHTISTKLILYSNFS